MQGAPLLAGEVIAFVVDNQIDNRTLGQGCRLVENQPSLLDTCSESAHMATVLDSKVLDKRSRAFAHSRARRSVGLTHQRVIPLMVQIRWSRPSFEWGRSRNIVD